MHPKRLSRDDILALQKGGRRISTPLFLIYSKPGRFSRSRIAITISKKEEETAVGRNRIKRRLRHALRSVIKNKHLNTQDVFIVARGQVKKVAWNELLRITENSMLKR